MIALQSLIERAARLNPTGIATNYKGTDPVSYTHLTLPTKA